MEFSGMGRPPKLIALDPATSLLYLPQASDDIRNPSNRCQTSLEGDLDSRWAIATPDMTRQTGSNAPDLLG